MYDIVCALMPGRKLNETLVWAVVKVVRSTFDIFFTNRACLRICLGVSRCLNFSGPKRIIGSGSSRRLKYRRWCSSVIDGWCYRWRACRGRPKRSSCRNLRRRFGNCCSPANVRGGIQRIFRHHRGINRKKSVRSSESNTFSGTSNAYTVKNIEKLCW